MTLLPAQLFVAILFPPKPKFYVSPPSSQCLFSSTHRGAPAKASNEKPAPRKRSFFADTFTQTYILTKKNFLVQGRSTTALLTQLFIGVIFLAILRLMQFSVETNPGEKAHQWKMNNASQLMQSLFALRPAHVISEFVCS